MKMFTKFFFMERSVNWARGHWPRFSDLLTSSMLFLSRSTFCYYLTQQYWKPEKCLKVKKPCSKKYKNACNNFLNYNCFIFCAVISGVIKNPSDIFKKYKNCFNYVYFINCFRRYQRQDIRVTCCGVLPGDLRQMSYEKDILYKKYFYIWELGCAKNNLKTEEIRNECAENISLICR